MSTPVPQKYARFEKQNDVHCNVKPNFNTAEESEPLPSNNVPYAAVNGHAADFVKPENFSNTNPSYNTSACDNIDRTMPRVPQQYGAGDFATPTFTSRGQSSETSARTTEITGSFKQENDLLSPGSDSSTTSNGLLAARPIKQELLNFDRNSASATDENDLENQLSQFERVLQGIKSRDESSGETESSNDIGNPSMLRPHSQSLGNGLNDGPEVKGNQLGLPNDNTTQLPTSSAQQYGISRERLASKVRERLASKVRFDRNMYLNPQGAQNNPRMATQRASNFPIRQRVFQQLQRKNLQMQREIAGASPQQLQARNPVMNPIGGNTAFPMRAKVRYSGITHNTQQAVSSFTHPTGQIHQNIMQPLRQPVQQPQAQVQGQIANLPRHQINMLAQQQQQKLAFQQQMASRLPSYSPTQHLARSGPVMDIRQKFSGVPATHANQHNPMQVTRAQQPLSHLQHYNPPGYTNQSGPPQTRPVQVPYSGDYPGYQPLYQYSQENKLHSAYQRHASLDDNLVTNRFHNPEMNQRNNFPYQRSSSLPGHAAAAGGNIFNQSSPPIVRLNQNEPNIPDMNNNGSDHPTQDLPRVHPQATLTHMKQQHVAGQSNALGMSQDQLYQGSAMSLAQSRPQPSTNLQTPLSNSFSNLLDMKSNSETSLFPFLGQELGGGTTNSSDFDSLLLKSPEFDILNMLDESQKTL